MRIIIPSLPRVYQEGYNPRVYQEGYNPRVYDRGTYPRVYDRGTYPRVYKRGGIPTGVPERRDNHGCYPGWCICTLWYTWDGVYAPCGIPWWVYTP